MFELMFEETKDQPLNVSKDMLKVGADMVGAQTGSLQDLEVFMMI